jgi:thiol-disulfide isomerase/thioredoxin
MAQQYRPEAQIRQQEQAFRRLVIKDAHGSRLNLQDYRGRVLIVDYWAHWCVACLAEMHDLEKMANDLAGQVEIILLSRPKDWQQDQEFAKVNGLPFHLYVYQNTDQQTLVTALRATSVGPTNFEDTLPMAAIFAANGTLAGAPQGRQAWSSSNMESLLRNMADRR